MQHSIWYQIGKTEKYMHMFFIDNLKMYNLTFEQGVILFIIEEDSQVCITQIATKLNKNKATISREVNSLVKKGFCIKNQPNNRRDISLLLTENGQKALSFMKSAIKQIDQEILKSCTQQEIDIFFNILTRMQSIFESRFKGGGGGLLKYMTASHPK